MSKLHMVSFVGVDAKTDFKRLEQIANNGYDVCSEWGILYSPKMVGQQRYASLEEVREFLDPAYDVPKSLHLCGDAVDMYLNDDPAIWDIINRTGNLIKDEPYNPIRVQLNFAIDKYDPNVFIDKIISNGGWKANHTVILQHNKSKAKFIEEAIDKVAAHFNSRGWFDILYDASGGFGHVLEKALPTFEDTYTGYAGGINPENVANIVKMIDKVATHQYYIDMESGIRTDDWLDLDKCVAVMDAANKIKTEDNKIFED